MLFHIWYVLSHALFRKFQLSHLRIFSDKLLYIKRHCDKTSLIVFDNKKHLKAPVINIELNFFLKITNDAIVGFDIEGLISGLRVRHLNLSRYTLHKQNKAVNVTIQRNIKKVY